MSTIIWWFKPWRSQEVLQIGSDAPILAKDEDYGRTLVAQIFGDCLHVATGAHVDVDRREAALPR